jgi:O-antigen/teichoic acid export membrane protein
MLVRLRPDWQNVDFRFRPLAAVHWSYGRWALATAAMSWLPQNLYYLVLPARGGLEAGAALRALMNLVLPALHTLLALGALLLPVLARRMHKGGSYEVMLVARRYAILFAVLAAAYLAVLLVAGARVSNILYQGKYAAYTSALFWVGLAPLAAGPTLVVGSALRAAERPDCVFWSYSAGAATTVTLGLGLVIGWGVTGAAAGLVASYVVTTLAMLLFWRTASRASSEGIPKPAAPHGEP